MGVPEFTGLSSGAEVQVDTLFASLADVERRMRRIRRIWAARRAARTASRAIGRRVIVSAAACGGRPVQLGGRA